MSPEDLGLEGGIEWKDVLRPPGPKPMGKSNTGPKLERGRPNAKIKGEPKFGLSLLPTSQVSIGVIAKLAVPLHCKWKSRSGLEVSLWFHFKPTPTKAPPKHAPVL